MAQSQIQNKLLRKLNGADFEAMWPLLEQVELTIKQELLHKGDPSRSAMMRDPSLWCRKNIGVL